VARAKWPGHDRRFASVSGAAAKRGAREPITWTTERRRAWLTPTVWRAPQGIRGSRDDPLTGGAFGGAWPRESRDRGKLARSWLGWVVGAGAPRTAPTAVNSRGCPQSPVNYYPMWKWNDDALSCFPSTRIRYEFQNHLYFQAEVFYQRTGELTTG
jgi:hypothetical protein